MNQVNSRSAGNAALQFRAAAACAALLTASAAQAQLFQFTMPGDIYRAGKVSAFSPTGSAVTGYLISDGVGGNSTPRAFTYTKTGNLLLDADFYTIGLAVSDDGLSAVRATASLSGSGFLPNGSKTGSMSNPAGATHLPFRSFASSADGLHLVGRDPSLPENGGFARRGATGTVVSMPTLPNLPEPRNVSVSRNGLAVACDFSTSVFSTSTPAVWTAEYGLRNLPVVNSPSFMFATVRQLSGDGRTVVGICVSSDTAIPGGAVTKGGFWAIQNGAASQFVEVPGFSSMAHVSDDGSAMFGYGENYDANSNAEMLLWTASGGTRPFTQYLAAANVQLPSDWSTFSIDSMSGDGLSFSGFATASDGFTDVAFIVTIPAPATAVMALAITGLLGSRRRR